MEINVQIKARSAITLYYTSHIDAHSRYTLSCYGLNIFQRQNLNEQNEQNRIGIQAVFLQQIILK